MALRSILLIHLLTAGVVWLIWLGLNGGLDAFALVMNNWQVALTMVFGSFIAGATSEGGGAIAFPVFTKLLQIAPMDAKVFSLAIQSVGMTAASVVIIAMGVRVDWRVIRWAGLGGVPGILLGAGWLAPDLSPPVLKMSFTFLVSSFAITLFMFNRGIRLTHLSLPQTGQNEQWIIALAGFIGGVMSGLVGNGIDIITFSVMVLLFHMSEKVATPTSVILMAFNSMVGFLFHLGFTDAFTPQVQSWWLAAIPVVVIGAPLGAIVCSRLDRHAIARFLIFLIAIELVTSLWLIPLSRDVLWVSLSVGGGFALLYLMMYREKRYRPEES
ncbi:sulfite exporter TauE/SafE family protein [Candidatus Reidiella endopervernicosa]|uniref:sulfite exporter TauE/SafE family protein n=1 Tax=Candidatus Reidiella endopervernicosa TaxID=2738883 RepID=UPI001EF119E3|nr:sulfite exporter TauE/SafE family protein [Candidatus Reidiella endopervernicosa]